MEVTLKRLPDWQRRLQALISDWWGRAFEYGKTDCGMFVASAVEAQTGVDLAKGFRGYTSEARGFAMLRRHGFDGIFERFADVIPPKPAGEIWRPGDLAAFEMPEGEILGVVINPRTAYLKAPIGLATRSTALATRGLRI